MNNTATVALVSVLAAGASIGAYRAGVIGPQYAEVVRATPVTVTEPLYADVVDVVPITQTQSVPEKVCNDQVVQVAKPERFGNKDGMVAGALVGGLIGNQVGGGDGRRVATLAGIVGGGAIGRNIDRRHTSSRTVSQSQRVCHSETRQESTTVGYEVQYQLDGKLVTKRMSKKPSDQVWVGDRSRIVGYDVDWRYRERSGTIRTTEKPGERLRMVDGAIVESTLRGPLKQG